MKRLQQICRFLLLLFFLKREQILTIAVKLEISNKLDILIYRWLFWVHVTSG